MPYRKGLHSKIDWYQGELKMHGCGKCHCGEQKQRLQHCRVPAGACKRMLKLKKKRYTFSFT
jgi:hypothetical protein